MELKGLVKYKQPTIINHKNYTFQTKNFINSREEKKIPFFKDSMALSLKNGI